jgi:FdhD protein
MTLQAFVEVDVERTSGEGSESRRDQLAVEEPLEIRLAFGPTGNRQEQNLSVTMRTPGHDAELAAGFLLSEGIIAAGRDIEVIRHEKRCQEPNRERVGHGTGGSDDLVPDTFFQANVVRVELRPDLTIDLARFTRHFYTTSSCGVCGKASIDALRFAAAPVSPSNRFQIAAQAVHRLPERLRDSQAVFARTGGLHAAALFDAAGTIVEVREDVGRHNAVDKLIGSQLLADRLPLADHGLLVSGRASFELVQKALMAGIPLLTAVGAPSSLAVDLARPFGMTLLGFVRDGRFNVYCGAQRISTAPLST